MTVAEVEVRRARRFGWTSLACWALLGLALEIAHGFKLAGYLDDTSTRTLLRLGHAHGVLLSLAVLIYSVAGAPLLADRADGGRRTGRFLRAAAVLIPTGFTLGAIHPTEADPSVGIFLVPAGAAALMAGLVLLAAAAWRHKQT